MSFTTGRKVIASILTILFWGLGHVYIGKIKRGIGVFLLGIVIMISASFIIPFPLSLLVGLAYLVWLIADVLKIIKLENRQKKSRVPLFTNKKFCPKCGNVNFADSVYCVRCGSPLL